jgi:argininosuccinate lyase
VKKCVYRSELKRLKQRLKREIQIKKKYEDLYTELELEILELLKEDREGNYHLLNSLNLLSLTIKEKLLYNTLIKQIDQLQRIIKQDKEIDDEPQPKQLELPLFEDETIKKVASFFSV